MTQDQPSRLDRIEAALENQLQVNAAMRTDIELLNRRTEDLRQAAELLLQTVQLHQNDINIIAQAIRQHRSDGHGA